VHIDLGGFAIRGPEFCAPGSCSPASAGGAIVHGFGAGGFRATIRNGTVTGFGGNCIQLRDGGRVDDPRVVMCGGYGIQLRSLFGDVLRGFSHGVALRARRSVGARVRHGPPASPGVGWVRTATTLFPDTLGWSNCTNWSTTSGTGTVLVLSAIWGQANNGQYSPWNVGSHFCVNANPVWCIED
jgi:hypothetical protein